MLYHYQQRQKIFIVAIEVEMIIDPDTFYLNEKTTIQCSVNRATEPLQLWASINGEERGTGCLYAAGYWGGYDNIFGESLLSATDCVTASQSAPFMFTLQPTVTEQLKGVQFWCGTYNLTEGNIEHTETVTVENIRGKLFSVYGDVLIHLNLRPQINLLRI